MADTGVSADATAMKTRRDGRTDTTRIATDTDHTHVRGRHTDVLTTETATNGGINHAETGIAAHLDHAHHAEVVTMTSAENIAGRIPVLNAQGRHDQSPDHHAVPGPMKAAGIKDDGRLLMSAEAADQSLIAHRPRR